MLQCKEYSSSSRFPLPAVSRSSVCHTELITGKLNSTRMLLARIPCWLLASRPETMPEWFSAAPWTSSATPSLTLLCRRPHLDLSGKYQCWPHHPAKSADLVFNLVNVVMLFLLFLSQIKNKNKTLLCWFLPGTRRQATWSWPRLCPAGCSRRQESWGWEMLCITVLESPTPPQRTPSPTLWWVVSRGQ